MYLAYRFKSRHEDKRKVVKHKLILAGPFNPESEDSGEDGPA